MEGEEEEKERMAESVSDLLLREDCHQEKPTENLQTSLFPQT